MQVLKSILLVVLVLFANTLLAHPMPNSILLLDVKSDAVNAELHLPLKELQLAVPEKDIETHPQTLISREGYWLSQYLLAHMKVDGPNGQRWQIQIGAEHIFETEQGLTGKYDELVISLRLLPPTGASPRHFTIYYDAIMHQVVTHKMLIRIRQDWDAGMAGRDSSSNIDVGVLMTNTSDNKVPPVIINLDEGSRWNGFMSMIILGMHHISEGTDHLLFLLVLILPAPLLAANKRWGKSGGPGYSISSMLKIASAFTLGHSFTLVLGALGWIRLPTQLVEMLITISILIGAVHALRPLFPRKEVFIAAGFGLIHGLAFAAILANLELDRVRMALSIFGFNVGIELMQLFVILLSIPWLIILSRYKGYRFIRIIGAFFALFASLGWIVERITQRPNQVSTLVQNIATKGPWIILSLAVLAALAVIFSKSDSGQLVKNN